MQLVNGGSVRDFPCFFAVRDPPHYIVKCAYGGLAHFRCILESYSRCLRIGRLACKEYRIKVVTIREFIVRKTVRTKWRPCQDPIMSTTMEEEEKTIGNKLKVLKMMVMKLTLEGSDKIAGTKSLKQIQR